MSQNKLIFGYWKLRGLGARIRLLLQYTKLPYKQIFYTPQTRQKWFNEEKPQLIKKNPAITLPYIIDGEQLISESDACAIYVIHKSKKVQLLGRNAEQQVNLATVMGIFKDAYKTYLQLIYGQQKQTFEELKPIYIQKLKPYLNKLKLIINEKEYYCGNITYVDFFVAQFIQHLNLLQPALFEKEYQNVIKHQKRVWQLPAIKEYISSESWIERPVNYVIGRWL